MGVTCDVERDCAVMKYLDRRAPSPSRLFPFSLHPYAHAHPLRPRPPLPRALALALAVLVLALSRLAMGFVHDRLVKLNNDISFLVATEQLWSYTQSSSLTDSNKLSAFVVAIKALHYSKGPIPDLEKVVLPYLDRLQDVLTADQPKNEEFARLQWLFLAKCTAIVYATVLDKLLAATLPLSTDIYYWEELQGSSVWSFYYALQSEFINAVHERPIPTKKNLSFGSRSSGAWGATIEGSEFIMDVLSQRYTDLC